MYRVNDLVVYPAQGVGKINRIDSKSMAGTSCDFYRVCIQNSNITLIVPVKNAQNVRTGKGRPNKRRFALPCHFEYIAADAL